jgi:hypothetical protein
MSIIISRIKNQMHIQENSFQAMVLGTTGSGKSLTAIKFCKEIDPTFSVKRIVLEPEDFVDLINADIQPGSAILCDEIGSWLSAREWYSLQNKLMSIVLETYRFKRLAVFWTVPNVRMVDVNLRDLCHAIIETVQVDRKNNICQCKFKYRTANPLTGKSYYKFPVTRNDDGDPVTLTRINVHRPNHVLEERYYRKKEKHLNKVYENIGRTLKRLKYRPRSQKKKRDLIIKDLRQGMTTSQIAKKRKTGPGYVREVRKRFLEAEL